MMRGYKCKNKKAQTILVILGFTTHNVSRGWILNRHPFKLKKDAPVRMHALIHQYNGDEYIDIHADFLGPNDKHVSFRGSRTERWNEIFRQIDHNEPCDAGKKLRENYVGLDDHINRYHARIKKD